MTYSEPYPIYPVLDDASSQLEQMGTKSKFWYRDEAGQRILFKIGRPGTGENWAEKVCCEVCLLLGIPHARYDFAVCKGDEGVITPSIVPADARLILGNELLGKIIKGYDEHKRVRVRQHTVRRVMAVISSPQISTPLGWTVPHEIETAADVMVGYLMLDALVSNQDRHHENWGLVLVPDHGLSLAPTFDHASSLGRNETDEHRAERLSTKDTGRTVEAYVRRAKTPFYQTPSSGRPLTTLEAFEEAAKLNTVAAEYWLSQLQRVGPDSYEDILARVPDELISDTAREFALKMLDVNSSRLRISAF